MIGYLSESGQAHAYPHKILNFHEIVNDEIDGRPVLISYCPLCRSGVVYDRRLDGRTLTFGNTKALFESDLVMFDWETNSYWWQVPGRAIVGTVSGAALTPLASETMSWSAWRELHPRTKILSRDLGFGRKYERDPFTGLGAALDAGRTLFPTGEVLPRRPAAAEHRGARPQPVVVGGEPRLPAGATGHDRGQRHYRGTAGRRARRCEAFRRRGLLR